MDIRERALRDALATVEARVKEERAAVDKCLKAGYKFDYEVAIIELENALELEARLRVKLTVLGRIES